MPKNVGRTVTKRGITRRLDWKMSSHLHQNALHRFAGIDCYGFGKTYTQMKRSMPLNLDQGSEGACTGFGAAHVLAASPSAQKTVTVGLAQDIYHQARREDEWEGEYYDGSSVNGAMHAMRTLGRIKSWRWISRQSELLHALSYHGAVQVGSPWMSGMWEPDADGYLHASGSEVGGHSYCISGFRPAPWRIIGAVDYWIDNSWGPDWGLEGGAWISDDDARELWFMGDGELAIPQKVSGL